jgi:hypothetical protein
MNRSSLQASLQAALTLAALAACSSGGSVPVSPIGASPAARAARSLTVENLQKSLVYLSKATANSIVVFRLDGKRIGAITKDVYYPQGIFVDAHGTLYVANSGANDVLEFKRGASSPFKVLTDYGWQAEDVTVCPDGTVYVANILKSGGGSGDIEVYDDGSRNPTRSLNWNGGGFFFFLTCDAHGNLFAALVPGTTGTVVEFPHGKQSGAMMLPIFWGGNPSGITADPSGNLLVAGQGTGVEEFTESGNPTGLQITTVGLNQIALSPDGELLLGASGKGGLQYTFPGGALDHTYRTHGGTPIGAAFDPGTN